MSDQTVELERLRVEAGQYRATISRLVNENRELRAQLARAIVLPAPAPRPAFVVEAARQHQLAVEHERHAREHGNDRHIARAERETALAFDALAAAIARGEAATWPDAPPDR